MATIRNAAATLFLSSCLVSVSFAEVTTSQPVQTLDRVLTFSTTGAIQMGFGDPLLRNPDFASFKATSSTGFTSCQLTATTGLVCLDGRLIRNWKDPKDSAVSETLFSCADERLGLDLKKPDTCTAMTIDTAGNFWLGGKKNSAHSLIKVVPIKNGSCPAPFNVQTDALLGVKGSTSPPPPYCAKEFASGRPLLQDISAVDGDEGKLFPYGAGILGLEERKTLVFFRDAPDTSTTSLDDPIVIASGKSGWALQGSEQIHGSTLLQRTVETVTDNFALVTTSTGRILHKEIKDLVPGTNTPASSNVFETTLFGSVAAVTIPGARTKAPACSSTAFYELRASTKSGMLYTTDRAACQIVAFKPNYLYDAASTPAVDPVFTDQANLSLTSDLTLLTAASSASYPPDGVTITPGIDVPLANCQGLEGCTVIPDNEKDYDPAQTVPGAKLSRVQYVGTKDNMALFQVQNVPDCRKFTAVNLGPGFATPAAGEEVPEACLQFATTDRVIIADSGGRGRYLNVAPLLPAELTELLRPYGTNGKLPEMLISPEHEATLARDFTFDAFVGFTDPSLVFRDTFTAAFDISQLLEEPRSYCGFENEDPDGAGPLTAADTNLKWDLITTVSERWPTVGGPYPGSRTAQKVDTLTNTLCENPTSGSGSRWSMYTYGLQPRDDGQRTYLNWVQRLYAELDETRYRFGCHASSTSTYGDAPIASESPVPPLSATTCAVLESEWKDGLFKLNKCIEASIDPKSSAGAENCQSFSSALKGYDTRLDSAIYSTVPAGFTPDPANRLGEIDARLQVLLHVFEGHFVPSIPPGGFGP